MNEAPTTVERTQASPGWRLAAVPWGVLAGGVAARLVPPYTLNHDCGWYLSVAERLLDGERLYLDVVVNNPPLIVYWNVLVVAIGRALGVATIAVHHLAVAVLIAVSLALAGRVLRSWPQGGAAARVALLSVVAALLTGFAGYHFGQREHLLGVLAVPYVLLAGVRATGGAVPSRWATFAVGVLAALGCALKPYYLLLPVLVQGWLMLRERRTSVALRAENLAFVAVLVPYAAHFLGFAPQTWAGLRDSIALALSTYGAYEKPFRLLLSDPTVLHAIAVGVVGGLALLAVPRARALGVPLLAAWASVLASALWQSKGWAYHFLPPLTFGWLLLAVALWGSLAGRRPRLACGLMIGAAAAGTGTALVAAVIGAGQRTAERDGLAALRSMARGGRLLVFDTNLSPHFPAVNYLDLGWTLRYPCLWPLPSVFADLPADAEPFPYTAERRRTDVEAALVAAIVADAQARPPELIIVRKVGLQAIGNPRFDMRAWIAGHAELGELFGGYTRVAETDELVFHRRD